MTRKHIRSACAAILLGALALGARAQEPALYVYSTIDALLAGAYDGDLTVRQLATKGNFGLGTYNHLHGEMVLLDGTMYRKQSINDALAHGVGTDANNAAYGPPSSMFQGSSAS